LNFPFPNHLLVIVEHRPVGHKKIAKSARVAEHVHFEFDWSCIHFASLPRSLTIRFSCQPVKTIVTHTDCGIAGGLDIILQSFFLKNRHGTGGSTAVVGTETVFTATAMVPSPNHVPFALASMAMFTLCKTNFQLITIVGATLFVRVGLKGTVLVCNETFPFSPLFQSGRPVVGHAEVAHPELTMEVFFIFFSLKTSNLPPKTR